MKWCRITKASVLDGVRSPDRPRLGVRTLEASIQRAWAALGAQGFVVKMVDTPADARAYVRSILPDDKLVFTASSETPRITGLEDDINNSGEYDALRRQLDKLDRNTQMAG